MDGEAGPCENALGAPRGPSVLILGWGFSDLVCSPFASKVFAIDVARLATSRQESVQCDKHMDCMFFH